MTIIERCLKKQIPEEVKKVATDEQQSVKFIVQGLTEGAVVIPINKLKVKSLKFKVSGIGKGLRTKINANIGTSPQRVNLEEEKEKLLVAIKYGADTVMDLSTGGDLRKIRKMILGNSTVPVGTVPIYQVACEVSQKGKPISGMDVNHLFEIIEEQAKEGVDFMTVHCGLTRKNLAILKKSKRIAGIVSRGGAFLAQWMSANNKENPLYEHFDRLLEIAYNYDVTLSLGDGLRPGAIADATDSAQIAELSVLGELVKRARQRRVQVMVEGPGHLPLDQIEKNVVLAKKLTANAPFYVLGPLVTDIAAGYDHIVGAIGGAVAGMYGADFLCYVTLGEHLRLPTVKDVQEGVIAARIAAHAADIAKGVKGAKEWDRKFSHFRKELDWQGQEKLTLDKEKFRQLHPDKLNSAKVCTMCGKYCALKISSEIGV